MAAGFPAVEDGCHQLRGVEAVIRTCLAAVVFATCVGADGLLLLTNVDAVYRDWGQLNARPLGNLFLAEPDEVAASGAFAAGSIRPKVRACTEFLPADGRVAAIDAPDDAARIICGWVGTMVINGSHGDSATVGSV